MEPTSSKGPKNGRKKRSRQSSDKYLAEQISDARLALESTLDDLKLDLSRAAELRRWVRRYPWAAIGTAFVAGFTLPFLVRSKRQRDAAAEETVEEVSAAADAAAPPKSPKRTRGREGAGGWRTAMIYGLFDILRLAVTQLITASVRQAASDAADFRTHASRDGRGDAAAPRGDSAASDTASGPDAGPPAAQTGAVE